MIRSRLLFALCLLGTTAIAQDVKPPHLANSFPPAESKGGWPSLVPDASEPDSAAKAKIRELGVDWDKLKDAWDWTCKADGKTGLIVIRKGQVVGEWYRDCDRTTPFNIYSSSKAYTSLAYGLILDDFRDKKMTTGSNVLRLDTKVCNEQWIPESLPLPDDRKIDITVRQLLQMSSGLSEEQPDEKQPFESSLGHLPNSPFKKLKSDPGKQFHYSNAGVAHLVLAFRTAAGKDEFPFLKEKIFAPIGMEQVDWLQIGGKGAIGPYSQGFSGIMTNPREHARFCYLALHKGEWAGKRLVPESYYDFAWKSSPANPTYGAQWWLYPRFPDAPKDVYQTAGFKANDGFVVPSLDLVFVRLGDGGKLPKDYEKELVMKVLAAVEKLPEAK